MLAIADCRLPRDIIASLMSHGFEPLLLPPFPALPPPVASHPDMLIFILGESLLTHRDYYAIAKEEINRICKAGGFRLILSDERVGRKYPSDILFNAAPVGRMIFARRDAVSHHISRIANDIGIGFIDIRQGYARCSILPVSESAMITADTGIARAALEHGFDTLAIRPGFVRLAGYNTGFIGGASGVCKDKVFFCGNIKSHPDADAIISFCAARGRGVLSLSDGDLFDAGTLFFI